MPGKTPPANPLDSLIAAAIQQATDPALRQWFRKMQRDGKAAEAEHPTKPRPSKARRKAARCR